MLVRLLGTAALALAIAVPAAAAGDPGTVAPQSMAPHSVYPEARQSADDMRANDRMHDEAGATDRGEMRSSGTMDEKERGPASPQSAGETYPQSE